MTIKVQKTNEDGKLIEKEIDDGLYSLYLNIGWEEVKPNKKDTIFKNTKKNIEENEEK